MPIGRGGDFFIYLQTFLIAVPNRIKHIYEKHKNGGN